MPTPATEETHVALNFTDATFTEEVENFKGVALIDFWAAWCPPCRAMAPVVEALAKKYEKNEQVKIGKVDADTNPKTNEKYEVLSLPTFIVFKDGKEVERIVGSGPISRLEAPIEQALAA